MNKYLFNAEIAIVAETSDEAHAILRNDPTSLVENAVIGNKKYTDKTVKGFTLWI